MLRLLLFVLPLGLDTFAVSAALGTSGLPKRQRLRVSLLMAGFEMVMPIIGLLVGRGIGAAVGDVADYIAIAILAAVGIWMLASDEDDEQENVARLSERRGLGMLALGLSVSLDEFAIGFTIGLLHLRLWLAILLIGLQAFLLSQAGLRLGARVNERAREGAERLAGLALLGLAVLLVVEKLV